MAARKARAPVSAEPSSPETATIQVDRRRLDELLAGCLAQEDLAQLRERLASLKVALSSPAGLLCPGAQSEVLSLRLDAIAPLLDRALAARTLQRAQHHVRRLQDCAGGTRTRPINDIDLQHWREYDEVLTDSLWIFPRRDTSAGHQGWYWGNFVPQIPHQLLLRYTRRGEWVLDPFVGSGTTLLECRRLGRHGLGVELSPEVAARARELVAQEQGDSGLAADIVVGNSTTLDFAALLAERGAASAQFLLMHPPYHDIIRFSSDPSDLSNAVSVERFLELFGEVVDRTAPVLDPGRYLAVVIGDKYVRQEWIPLGFLTMQEVLRRGFTLKSIVVKNYEETRAKRRKQGLWRYRALAGGFYLFKHEYVLIFRKVAGKR